MSCRVVEGVLHEAIHAARVGDIELHGVLFVLAFGFDSLEVATRAIMG